MLKLKILKWSSLIAIIVLAGCTPKKPLDTSNPSASLKWIEQTIGTDNKSAKDAFTHALELKKDHPNDETVSAFFAQNTEKLKSIIDTTFHQSIASGDFKAFSWALEQNPNLKASNAELLSIWKKNPDWQKKSLDHFPNALSVFMFEAVKDMHIFFFDKHMAEFKATNYKLEPQQSQAEYEQNLIKLLGSEAQKSIRKKDTKRILILLSHIPSLKELKKTSPTAQKNIKAIADYALYTANDEQLIAGLVSRGYPLEGLELDKVDFNSALVKGLIADPKQATTFFGLDKATAPLTRTEASFLLKLPTQELTNLHPQHINEIIAMCMEAGGSEKALEFINLKNTISPLQKDDYIRLMTLAILHNDLKILPIAKKKAGNLQIQDLDLNLIAGNPRAFIKYAPAFLKNIEDSMELEPQKAGITLGKIKQILGNENQDAGLYIVKKYDLSERWLLTTNNRTLLMDACEMGNLDVVRYLIEKRGENLAATTRYSTPQTSLFGSAAASEGKLSAIFFAAQNGNPELIKYLVAKGANVNASSNFGATPLMFAASNGNLEGIKTLLSLHAKPNTEMKEEHRNNISENGQNYNQLKNAYQRALAGNYSEILQELKNAGAHP